MALPHIRQQSWSMVVPSLEGIDERTSKARVPSQRVKQLKFPKDVGETKLPTLPSALNFLERSQHAPQALMASDLHKSELREEMSSLKLGDYFDVCGKPHFTRLGLTFAAKQMLPSEGLRSCTSVAKELKRSAKDEDPSGLRGAKAFIQAQEAVSRDMTAWKAKADEYIRSIPEDQRYNEEEVKQRQSDIYFSEVPGYVPFLPAAVRNMTLEGPIDSEEETRSRFSAGRANTFFEERGWSAGFFMSWTLRRPEVLALSDACKLWSVASWGAGGAQIGMDRSTFCRFLFDVGLVDQNKVPYFWAVSLFDQMSFNMRCCKLEDNASQLAPLLPVVNRWELISILDTIIKQHFGTVITGPKTQFLTSLLDIAEYRLPVHVFREANINKETWAASLRGETTLEEEESKETPSPRQGSRFRRADSIATVRRPTQQRRTSMLDALYIEQEDTYRFQRLRCLLTEPEVLQLLWQHEEVFRRLHKAYADEEGGSMSFSAVAQLCSDLWLAPTLVTAHGLKKMYESVECVVVQKIEKTPAQLLAEKLTELTQQAAKKEESQRMSSESIAPKKGTGKRGSVMPTRRRSMGSIAAALGEDMPSRQSSIPSSPSGNKRDGTADSRRTSLRPSSSLSKDNSDSGSRRGSIRPSRRISQILREKSSLLKPRGTMLAGLVASEPDETSLKSSSFFDVVRKASYTHVPRWPMSFPWQGIMSLLENKDLKEDLCKAVFGHEAVMELISKLGFAHLSFYGNMQQRSMTGFMQSVWILTYLRFILQSLRKSLDKRGLDAEAEEKQFGALSRAVRSITPDLFELGKPPIHKGEDNPQQPTFRETVPSTPEGLGLLSSRERRPRSQKVGSPFVENGTCKVCQLAVDADGWGNLRCYGCSRLDSLALARHPLSPLLFDRQLDEKPEALAAPTAATRARRRSLSPPPVRGSDSFTEKIEENRREESLPRLVS
mmetsp:Transcript_75699/g.133665  ORF Transcript_75699/g.133665 Transcript_75699/m.133665 type:complete len:949 (-) Transcript_75699:88-2934(-)